MPTNSAANNEPSVDRERTPRVSKEPLQRTPAKMKRVSRFLLGTGFALLIFGSKLWLIDAAGSDLPTWDQWDAEAQLTLRPWTEGTLGVEQLIRPHNEHRVVTTKLYALGLFYLNSGQWSAFVETTANAVVHVMSAILLLMFGRRFLPTGWLAAFGGLLVVLFGLPFSWENTITGFQIQFYFLQLFSLLHIWFSLESERFSRRWLFGQFSGVLALATMASGFLSSIAVLTVLGFHLVQRRRLCLQQVATAGLAIAIILVGWFMSVHIAGHAFLMAHNAREFMVSLLQLLAWPGTAIFPWSVVLMVPALVFVSRLPQRRLGAETAVLLGFLGWIALQCAAIAYGRGGAGGTSMLASRYLDLLAINVAVSFLFVVREFSGRARLVTASIWGAVVVAGLVQQSQQHWRDSVLPGTVRHAHQQENVSAYLKTGDGSHLLDKPWAHVPYPNGPHLLSILQSPVVQEMMPPSVRRPVPLRAPGSEIGEIPDFLQPSPFSVALSTKSHDGRKPLNWRSADQPDTSMPMLRFRVAGDLGPDSSDLQLIVKSAAGEMSVRPDVAPGERWKNVAIRRPAGVWWVEAVDANPNAWFAFTEPVELGYGTWLAEKLLKHHVWVLLAAVGLLGAGAGLTWRVTERPNGRPTGQASVG